MSETAIWELPSNHSILADHVELDGNVVVDVGSGGGELVRFARSAGADAIGIECGEAMIAKARAADPAHRDSYREGVGQDLPLDDETADVVVFSYSLHHVPADDMAAALSEAHRVLRTGGTLAVLEPIASGPGHETFKPIVDETVVRAEAQAALDNDLPNGFDELDEVRYTTSYAYRDLLGLEKDVVDIDPSRRDVFDSVRDEVAALFEKNGAPHDDQMWFAQPVVMRRFSKR